jgi:hypothetical protein
LGRESPSRITDSLRPFDGSRHRVVTMSIADVIAEIRAALDQLESPEPGDNDQLFLANSDALGLAWLPGKTQKTDVTT